MALAITFTAMSFAQDYGKYSMQHTDSETELQQYVGQRVKVMSRPYGLDSEDFYIFSHRLDGTIGAIYTIKKIKVGSQIVIDLVSESGEKIKAKVNADGKPHDTLFKSSMASCKSFFLVDKFEADRQNLIGKEINNSAGQPVAKIVDLKMVDVDFNYPQSRIEIQSDLDGTTLVCTEEEAISFCSNLGKILSHPMVKHKYKVVGFKTSNRTRSDNAKNAEYNVQNMDIPNEIYSCNIGKPERDAFRHDLKGHYVSVLTQVEKPSNPAIRYGKTTVVEDKKISKYSYVDNVIDILIFGGSEQFDFILKNVSDNSIKVIWNEAVFVGFDGTTSKIMHVGTRYSQREGDQPATTIIKGAKIEDLAAPTCNVRYSSTLKEWVTDSMYPSISGLSPGKLRLMLPIQIKEVVNEYVFVFDVNYVYDYPERLNL